MPVGLLSRQVSAMLAAFVAKTDSQLCVKVLVSLRNLFFRLRVFIMLKKILLRVKVQFTGLAI